MEESIEEEQEVEESIEEEQQVEESIEEEQQQYESFEEEQQVVGTTEFENDATQALGMIDDGDMYTTNIGYIEEESDFNFSQGWVKYDLNENDQFKNVYFNVDRDQYIESFQTHAIQVETIPYINDIFKQIHNNLTSEYQAMSETYKLTNQYYHDLAPSNTFLMYRFEPYTKGGKIKKNCYIVSFDCSVEGRNDLWRGTLFFNRQEELQMANIEIVDKNKVSHKIKVECKYVKSTSRVDTYKYTSSGKRLKKAEFNSNNANHLHIKKGQKLPQWSNYTEEQMQRFKELLTSKSVSDSQKEQVRAKIIENVKEDEIQFNIIYK